MSMCTLDTVTLFSQICGNVQAGNGGTMARNPFRGLNIMLISDFHQFPPVAHTNLALYCPPSANTTSIVGKAIYLQFTTIVTLLKQERITDHTWLGILQKVQIGDFSEMDIAEIRKLKSSM
jgi:hypothetical protein